MESPTPFACSPSSSSLFSLLYPPGIFLCVIFPLSKKCGCGQTLWTVPQNSLVFSSSALTHRLTLSLMTRRTIVLCYKGASCVTVLTDVKQKPFGVTPWYFQTVMNALLWKIMTGKKKESRIQKLYSSGRKSTLLMSHKWNCSTITSFHLELWRHLINRKVISRNTFYNREW